MTADLPSPQENCPACGISIDVSGFEPLTPATCPHCGASILVGSLFGEYELLDVMGRGGMGVVYRAMDLGLARPVALKVLRKDRAQEGVLSELEAEAAVTASINHPNVVKVFTTGTAGGRFFIAMELVDKGTLDDLISLQGRVAEAQALEIAIQIAQGLRAAHQHGLIHRDVKPGNILFADAHTAKIVDFGLALMEEHASGSGEIWGTPYYISPERLDQKPEDFRSDMYSLGATIFHALAGRPPFEAENATLVALKHLKSQAVSLQAFAPWVSGSTAYVINHTLLKDPQARYGSYDELIEHLEYARSELMTHRAEPQGKKRVVLETDEDRKRWGYLTTAMILVLLVIGGVVAFFYFSGSGPAKPEARTNPIAASVGATGAYAEQYETARQSLLHDRGLEAAALFRAMAADPATPQPLAQWCALQHGLAQLVTGHLTEGRAAFAALGTRPYTGHDAAGTKLAAFFARVAALGSSADPVAPSTLKGTDPASYEALALLIAGLKDWELGRFEDGAAMLREFQSVDPQGGFVWVGAYRDLAGDYLSDFSDYRGAMAMAKGAQTVPELQRVAAMLRKVRGDLKHSGTTKLSTQLEAAAVAASAAAEEKLRQAAAQLEAEKKSLAAARDKAASLCQEWKMKEARGVVAGVALTAPDLLREQRALVKKTEWLAGFKETLLKDLAAGITHPIKKKDGSLATGIIKASEDEFILESATAPALKWNELAPASLLELALSYLTPEVPAGPAAERRWRAGVYALLTGLREESRKLLQEAAKGSGAFTDALPLLLPPHRAELAKGKPVQGSDDGTNQAPAEASAAKVVDGNPATRWLCSQAGDKWVRVDLGKPLTVNRWLVRHGGSHGEGGESNTVDFSLERSLDDSKWEEVETVRGNTFDITDRHVPPFSARYVRLTIKDKKQNRRPNDPSARIYGLEVYGSDGGSDLVSNLWAAPSFVAVPELASHDLGLAPTEPTGSTSVDERTGLVSLRGSGADIGKNADAGRFWHRKWTGDGQLVIRVEAMERGNESSKGGIMAREGMAPEAKMVFLGVTPQAGLVWQVRKETQAAASEVHVDGFMPPCWLKMVRAGNVFTASASMDGHTWKQIGSETVAIGAQVEGGLAVTARAVNATATLRAEMVMNGR